MKVQNIQSSNMNFKSLYMPAEKELLKYGKNFATSAEKQRAGLEKLAQKADIYIIPRMKDADLALAKAEFLDEFDNQFDFDLIDEVWPKGNYFNIHIFPRNIRNIEAIEKRKDFSAMEIGVEADEIKEVTQDMMSEPNFARVLDSRCKSLNKIMKTCS